MELIMNTYGLFSISIRSYNNQYSNEGTEITEERRDDVVTPLKAHNLTLGILGYIPGVSIFSGSLRVFTGSMMVALTLIYGNMNEEKYRPMPDHFFNEELLTGITQIARGILEVLWPLGLIINAPLDFTFTFINLYNNANDDRYNNKSEHDYKIKPHPQPEYSSYLCFLNWV
jgi:hypothetical protein